MNLISLASLWGAALLPGDPFAQHQRRAALRGLTMRLVSILARRTQWRELEETGLRDDEFSFWELRASVGDERYQKDLVEAIRRRLSSWQFLEPSKRAIEFASTLAMFKHHTAVDRKDEWFSTFLLKLASDPAALAEWSTTEILPALHRVIASPLLMRIARFVVLAIHMDESDDVGSIYRGWSWT
jgi:hypothetical protein